LSDSPCITPKIGHEGFRTRARAILGHPGSLAAWCGARGAATQVPPAMVGYQRTDWRKNSERSATEFGEPTVGAGRCLTPCDPRFFVESMVAPRACSRYA
jgi:hypothetical protein